MIILVIDVAAEFGGALTILDQFLSDYEKQLDNEYYVVLSKPEYTDRANLHFIRLDWVKKSYLHRLYFDNFYIRRIIKLVCPDRIVSLQNKCVSSRGIAQDVYFQSILPLADYKFGIKEARNLWIYQNIIGPIYRRSLKKADTIIVQADWIKQKLSGSWSIDSNRILVKRPSVSDEYKLIKRDDSKIAFFYPANGSVYKNHERVLNALKKIWDDKSEKEMPELFLTCNPESLSQKCHDIISEDKYPITFTGYLGKEQMKAMYSRSAIIFPSFIETVGLPLLEAREAGCDILSADCEYAHETIGDYDRVLYFDPFDENSITYIVREYIQKREIE